MAVSITQEGTGSVRFVSVPYFSKSHRFGSVRFGNCFFRFDAVRPTLSDASWLGPEREREIDR